ncbi:BhlA/UviB family holin-like peptide [Clostridiisalibacter paucivorans]|uniref:BhlA/UviB family holin-like peptide n=1 Tax=Clostridiisalibacter paucivorans TaxID=408753 RepID=UPI000478A8C3|nr:BhlA/UviB family holin-like peptide [Clostridiisalibacter paucivorans]
MEEKIIELASSQGIWTLLTILLIFYILKSQEKRDLKQEDRERKYQEIIASLTDKLNLIEDVKQNVEELKNYVYKKTSGD